MSHVATTKIFENEKIIVWEMVLEPGESSGVHTHEHDYVFHVIEGSTGEILDKEGNQLGILELKAGDTMFLKLDGEELVASNLRVPITHNARNAGTTRYKEILIETKS